MTQNEVQINLEQPLDVIINYLNSSPKPKVAGLGYCIAGQFIGEKIFLKPNPIFASQILNKVPLDHANVLSIFSTTNDIYVIETNFTIYIVPFKPLAYSFSKPIIDEQLDIIVISPIETSKSIIVREASELANSIYLVTSEEQEQYVLLSYQKKCI